MIFYWYVIETGWNDIYDLHIKSLNMFSSNFDKVTFVISQEHNDSETYKKFIYYTIEKLREIRKDAVFVMCFNDKTIRSEAVYFYESIAHKLDSFDNDEIVFFAHSKGLTTSYVSKQDCIQWIKEMYFFNLNDFDKIFELFKKETLCSVGIRKRHVKAFPAQRYYWHYSGTYFWMYPYRIARMIKQNHETIPQNTRMFAEGFLGSVLPDSEEYDVDIESEKCLLEEKTMMEKIYS